MEWGDGCHSLSRGRLRSWFRCGKRYQVRRDAGRSAPVYTKCGRVTSRLLFLRLHVPVIDVAGSGVSSGADTSGIPHSFGP